MLNPLTVHCPTDCAILSGVPSFPNFAFPANFLPDKPGIIINMFFRKNLFRRVEKRPATGSPP